MKSLGSSNKQVSFEKKSESNVQLYHFIIENTNELIAILDKNFRHEFINRSAYLEILGFSEEDILGKLPRDFIHPDDLPKAVSAIKKGLIKGNVKEQFRIQHKNGNYVWVEAMAKMFDLGNGEFKILFMSKDITNSIQIKESEAKFRSLFKNSPYLIFIVDIGGKIVDLNKTALKHLRFDKDYFIGKNFKEISVLDAEDIAFLMDKFNDLLIKRSIGPFEIRLEKSLNLNWLSVRADIINLGEKQLIQIIMEDISRRKEAEEALKLSEVKFQNIVENTKEAIVIIGLEGEIRYVSPQLSRMLKGQFIKKVSQLFQYIHEADLQQLKDYFKDILRSHSIYEKTLDFRIKTDEDKYVWVSSTSKNYFDENGVIIGFISTIKDITDRKFAEKTLKDSEIKYRLITENANDLIRVLDKNFNIEFLNEKTHQKVLGYSKDELLNKKDISFNHPDDFRSISRFMMKVFKSGEGFHESRLRHKNGHYIWFEVKIKCFKGKEDQRKYLLVYRDISERKKAEVKLKESEEMYRNLYENSPNAIVLTDSNGIILDQNQASEKVYGYKPEEVYGKKFEDFDVFSEEQIEIIRKTFDNSLKGIKVSPRELLIKKRNGTRAWISFQLSVLKQKGLILVETIAHDISEEKKAKMLIEKENEKLLELSKMKTELVSRVSHELKTPLSSIYGGSQILLNLHQDGISKEAMDFVKMIHKGGIRLKNLIENLLDISKIESGELNLNIKKHNIAEIIMECVEDIQYFANERNITIRQELLENMICEIDKFRIEQVITNLLSNAIKNTPPKGSIKIILSQKDDDIYISVQDTGVGLTLGEMDKLFNKFGKIERYGQRMNVGIEGSGLGLFITKEIVDLHKGTIWVSSEGKNKGARFTVRLNKFFESRSSN